MADLLTSLGLVVTDVLGYVGDIATVIVSTPILLLTTGVLILGAAIGIFSRLLAKS